MKKYKYEIVRHTVEFSGFPNFQIGGGKGGEDDDDDDDDEWENPGSTVQCAITHYMPLNPIHWTR